jgi:hypothetical protein
MNTVNGEGYAHVSADQVMAAAKALMPKPADSIELSGGWKLKFREILSMIEPTPIINPAGPVLDKFGRKGSAFIGSQEGRFEIQQIGATPGVLSRLLRFFGIPTWTRSA